MLLCTSAMHLGVTGLSSTLQPPLSTCHIDALLYYVEDSQWNADCGQQRIPTSYIYADILFVRCDIVILHNTANFT